MKDKKIFKTLPCLIALLLLTVAIRLPVGAEETDNAVSDTADTADINNNTTAGTAEFDNNPTADTANVNNNPTTDTADVNNNSTADTADVNNNSTADTADVDNNSTADTDEGNAPPENTTPTGVVEANPFEEIYNLGVENADKIFSVLAFLGTLIVGIGYKSGFLPLLRDALSKLKSAIDTAKEESDKNTVFTAEKMQALTAEVESIGQSLEEQSREIARIQWQFEGYDALIKERQALRLTLEGQMDMLYAIFMQSTLPKYQKDEIGERISKLREELKSYEIPEN